MKFLIISNLYEPYARGGAEAVVKMTAEGLRRRGHEVMILTAGPRKYGLWPKEDVVNGVRVLRFFPLNIYFVRDDWRFSVLLRALARLIDIFNIQAAWAVKNVVKKEKPDVIISHNLVGIGLLTFWGARSGFAGRKVPTIHVLHDVQLIHPSGLLVWGSEAEAEHSPLRKIYERITRLLMGSPDVVVASSKWLLEFHTKRGFFPRSETAVLPNPVDGGSVIARNVHDEAISSMHLFYAGQLEPHKGIKWLLEIFSGQHDMALEIAGSGSLECEVRRVAGEHPGIIKFHGKVAREELFKKFGEVDALVVPSLCYENAPQVIAEALAAGLPVIASRIGGIPEMVRDGENGSLFTPANKQEFLQAVSSLLSSRARSRDLIHSHDRGLMTVDCYLDRLLELC